MTNLRDLPLETLDGRSTTFGELIGDRVALVVNVASKCGLTPQYTKLEQLQAQLAGSAFTVVGFPCNQFGGQEPGTSQEIAEFCSDTYGVTFPMTAKVDVNGAHRNPIYDVLTAVPDTDGESGDVQWNFEKFLIGRDGEPVARFRPRVEPDDFEVTSAIAAAIR
jgi:glutathione peroxidase